MSARLINRSDDLKRLRDEGYELEIRQGYLVINSVPYVNPGAKIALGRVVTDLTLNNEQTIRPANHQVWFAGDHPCNRDGSIITAIQHTSQNQTLSEDLVVNHRFSCKPKDGYPNHYEKMTRYIDIISNPARSLDPSVSAKTFKPVRAGEEESVFLYTDTASSYYGITALTEKISMNKIAFVGLGGTGAYCLDFVTKTPVHELHLFDGDPLIQRNAFRAPGAVSLNDLEKMPFKADYYAGLYGQMRRGLYAHNCFLDEQNVHELKGFSFVFICVDNALARRITSNFLIENQVPFIDVGMELEYVEENQCLIGTCRVTLCTSDKSEHFKKYVSLEEVEALDIYDSNIQIAELNAMNAALAVQKWKKYCGFYQDCYQEYHSAYSINSHQLTRDETVNA